MSTGSSVTPATLGSKCACCGKAAGAESMSKCNRCKSAAYCGRDCQKRHWKTHKNECEHPPSAVATASNLEELRAAIDAAPPGGVVLMGEGSFGKQCSGGEPLVVRKPIEIRGRGVQSTFLYVPLVVEASSSSEKQSTRGGTVRLEHIRVFEGVQVKDNDYKKIMFVNFYATVEDDGKDVFEISECRGEKVLLLDSEITGGSDGLCHYGSSTNLHIKRCRIGFCGARGIFANDCYIIEDSCVHNCGGYGMKTRGGCTIRGNCDIQPGPWDQHNPYGGMF